jgi:molecular chaperone DnaK (HSP70)
MLVNSLGIDFGTGNTVLAECCAGRASIFVNIGESGSVRSDIGIDKNGSLLVDPCVLSELIGGVRLENSIKRKLIIAIDNGNGDLSRLVSFAAARLRYIYDFYQAETDEKAVKAVLTCPANTGQAYRDVLLDIGRQIGLPSVDIVDEPTAAAVHHGLGEVARENERWMVVDWGCGTCDVSLIQRKEGSRDLKVVCVEGENDLGGLDMDRLLADHLGGRFGFRVEDVKAYEVEAIKKHLSSERDVSAPLALTDGKHVDVFCSRGELEGLVQPLLSRAKGLVDKALASAGWRESGVERIIATGGPMLMPCVKRMISEIAEEMGADLHDTDPLTSVALGAARLAEMKRMGGVLVTNKVSKSIGIRVADEKGTDGYHKVIHRGEDRPVTRPVTLATSVDLQDIIEIEIREGDNDVSAEANTLLARLNAVVRPENKGAIKVKLQIALSDAGGMEAYIEPLGDKNTVRDVQAVGVRLEKGQRKTETGELRTEDPVSEFKDQVIERQADPDTARQVYERLKIKYHPDRQPEKRDHWNSRLAALDDAFSGYLAEIEKRMRASTAPNLPWDNPAELDRVMVDEVLGQRLTHCLANGIGSEDQKARMPGLLKRFPDYRRVLASYLFGIKRNAILQKMLAEDDRPHVGLVVLLQNIPGKPIRERHEVLKAAYRVKEAKVRELLADPNLDMGRLYEEAPKIAEAPVNPMGGPAAGGATRTKVELKYDYRGKDTVITGNTFAARELIKEAARKLGTNAVWNGKKKEWVLKGKHVTDKDIFG